MAIVEKSWDWLNVFIYLKISYIRPLAVCNPSQKKNKTGYVFIYQEISYIRPLAVCNPVSMTITEKN